MENHNSQASIKTIGTVYMYWLFFGVHYAYFGKWGLQILYWITFGGLGVWAIIDFMSMPEKIIKYRESIFEQNKVIGNYKNLTLHVKTSYKTATGLRLDLVS